MPIYGYACTNCGHTLDALPKIADEPLVLCPDCDEPKLKRQLSAPRFRLKGAGWYETDFKSDNQRNIAGDKEAKSSDDKSDDKSADKSDTTKSDDKKSDDKKSDTKSDKKTEKKKSKSKDNAD